MLHEEEKPKDTKDIQTKKTSQTSGKGFKNEKKIPQPSALKQKGTIQH